VDIVPKSRPKWFYQPDDDSTNFGWVLVDVTALKTPITCQSWLGLGNISSTIW
jgi:hypothetical protein